MQELYIYCLLFFGALILLASIDDLIIDFLVLRKLKEPRIPDFQYTDESDPKAKSEVAIFVANWHEEAVLAAMVEGNLRNLEDERLRIVLGVYPNDKATLEIAKRLAKTHPKRVQVVVNRRDGPTSKGQMLNEMFNACFADRAAAPDLVVVHDSEDIIASGSFDVYRHLASDYAMIQIPVFSLDSRDRSLVAATYMEEFAERHTREMILRASLGAFIPSAGVGTCLRRDVIEHFLNLRGHVFDANSVTEDYVLGAEADAAGFRTTFAAFRDPKLPDRPVIATVEYFPKELRASIRQKTRWVYGIAFESAARLGWNAHGWNLFFLYRDRKGAIANLLPVLSLLLLFAGWLLRPDFTSVSPGIFALLSLVLLANTGNIFIRILFKSLAFRDVYGTFDIIGLLVRWPVAFFVNAIAVCRAWRMFFVESRFASKGVAWAKTSHEVPVAFDFMLSGGGLRAAPELVRAPFRLRPQTRGIYAGLSIVSAVTAITYLSLQGPNEAPRFDRAAIEMAAAKSIERAEAQATGMLHRSLPMTLAEGRRALEMEEPETPKKALAAVETEPPELPDRGTIESDVRRSLSRSALADHSVVELAGLFQKSRAGNRDRIRYAALETGSLQKPFTSAQNARKTSEALRAARLSIAANSARDDDILQNMSQTVQESELVPRHESSKMAKLAIASGVERDRLIQQKALRRLEETMGQHARWQSTGDSSRQPLHSIFVKLGEHEQRQQVAASAQVTITAGARMDDAFLTEANLMRRAHAPIITNPHQPVKQRELAALFAKASISASTGSDTVVLRRSMQRLPGEPLQRVAVATHSAVDASELTSLYKSRLSKFERAETRKRNISILRLIFETMPENSIVQLPPNISHSKAVEAAQLWVNSWLEKSDMTLEDIGMATTTRACRKRLCVDGILGPKTKSALQGALRHQAFAQKQSRRKLRK
jgi:cellulose synthase/poly-beta-1,6-N-acetylglucosamine synthase-like glycosyltransferase